MKTRRGRLIIVSFFYLTMYCQKMNTLTININLKEYQETAVSNVLSRYNYTIKNRDRIKDFLNLKDTIDITKIPFDSLEIKTIPVLYFSSDADITAETNILNFLHVNIDPREQFYTIYYHDKIIMDSFYKYLKTGYDFDPSSYSLLGDDYIDPIRTGSLSGYLKKLMLEKKYFTFAIRGVGDTVFIVDGNKVYAIYWPKADGRFEKTEINEFFAKTVGRLKLEKIIKGSLLAPKEKELFSEENYFKENYYFEMILP